MSEWMRRGGRILVVVAIVLIFAVSLGSAGPTRAGERTGCDCPIPMAMIKAPVAVIKTIAITEARLEHHVRTSLHHVGMDALLRAIHWFARGARTFGERSGIAPER